MGVIALSRFETQPGQLAKHLELHVEAVHRLRGLGLRAVAMQPLVGGDIGSLAISVNYADNAEHVASTQKVMADAGWQEFYVEAMASGAAQQVESSLFSDLDPAYQPETDRPLGCVLATQWRPMPGRLADFLGKVTEAHSHEQRFGVRSRPMQSVIGADPLSILIVVGFADLEAYGAYADTSANDPEWQAFWGEAIADPSADLIRSGLYLNISGD